jgi:hypothetical protein
MSTRHRTTRRTFLGNTTIGAAAATASGMVPSIPWTATAFAWLRARDGHDYYVRQLRDMKYSAPIDELEPCGLDRYADLCGWALARSHARSGDALAIGGYLGRGDQFDLAIGKFAVAYADQTEQDHAALMQAHRAGRIVADGEAD